MPGNRLNSVSVDAEYVRDVQMSGGLCVVHSPPQIHRVSENEASFSKHMLRSEASREFTIGRQLEPSRIKHQQLREAQYRLKGLFKA